MLDQGIAPNITGLDRRAISFANRPANFFNGSYTEMQSMAREELCALQLSALRLRFASLRDSVPMLKQLADSQRIEAIDKLENVVPLLFEHTIYKSYPPSLLENARFGEINKFLSRLCTFDLTDLDVSRCKTIDEWLEVMDRETPLQLVHSSGSSGTMSFLPLSRWENEKHGEQIRITAVQEFGDDPDVVYRDPFYAVYPSFRHGGSSNIRLCETMVRHIAGSEDRLRTAFPGRMSSDLLYLGAKLQAAAAKGELGSIKISLALRARKSEFEALQAEMPSRLEEFFEEIADELRGKRIFFIGTQNLLFGMAKVGRSKGLSAVFAQNSVISHGGDVKGGVAPPSGWREEVCRFAGVEKTRKCYGMTEARGLHHQCRYGHYHFAPWIVVYVLDPETGLPMPRTNRSTGRAAFFDLGAETRWGGFISGDEITVEWEQECPCGQSTIWAEDTIERYSVKRGGDDKINCAAAGNAHQEAMSFLTDL